MPTSAKTHRQRRRKQSGPGHRFYNSRCTSDGDGWRDSGTRKGIRSRHLAEHPYCVSCLEEGKPTGQCLPVKPVVDHVVPFKDSWRLFSDSNNLQTLCHWHHSRKTASENA